jgi:chitinase
MGTSISIEKGRRADTTWTRVRAVYTRKRFTVIFDGTPNNLIDDGIPDECAPAFEVDDDNGKHPGYALLIDDPCFFNNKDEEDLTALYASAPSKRDRIEGRGLVTVGTSSSRVATPEELRREFGFDACSDDQCSREMAALKSVVGLSGRSLCRLYQPTIRPKLPGPVVVVVVMMAMELMVRVKHS